MLHTTHQIRHQANFRVATSVVHYGLVLLDDTHEQAATSIRRGPLGADSTDLFGQYWDRVTKPSTPEVNRFFPFRQLPVSMPDDTDLACSVM